PSPPRRRLRERAAPRVMLVMNANLTTALEMHQAGRFGPAARMYQEVLRRDRESADALHLLGVLHHQKGEHARAVERMCQAVALRPGAAASPANLAEAYRALGQFGRAAGCCRTALRLRPDYPEALCNLGLALQGLGAATKPPSSCATPCTCGRASR